MPENLNVALLSLIPAFLNAGIIFYIFFYLPKSKITDIFTCFVVALMLWQCEDTIVRLCHTAETARFWDKILCMGWLGMAPFAFHFSCKLSSLKELTSKVALFFIYSPFVLFYILYVGNNENSTFILDENWGWVNTPKPGTLDEFQRYWISLMVMATVFILIRHAYLTEKNINKKFQAWIIALGILVPALQGIITQVIFPLLADIKEIPLTSTFMSVFSLATIISISKYKLFQVSESIQSDMLLESLKNIILIISPDKKIIYVNKFGTQQLGLDEDEIGTAYLSKIFYPGERLFEKYEIEVFKRVLNGETINNYPSLLMSMEQKKMNVLITSSQVINNNILQGVMLVVHDVTEMVTTLKELEFERQLKEKAITEAVIVAQEKERKTLGFELHDNINQLLASSLLYLNIAKNDNIKSETHLDDMGGLIHQAISEIRKLSHSLIAPSLNETELTEAIDKIIDIAGKTGILKVEKEIKGIEEKLLSEKFKLNIYRIVQEQFNNIIKYACAKTIKIKLVQQGKTFFLCIKDDGIGFDPLKISAGVGLTNIKTRASLHNGEINIISSPGKGCELSVCFENVHSMN